MTYDSPWRQNLFGFKERSSYLSSTQPNLGTEHNKTSVTRIENDPGYTLTFTSFIYLYIYVYYIYTYIYISKVLQHAFNIKTIHEICDIIFYALFKSWCVVYTDDSSQFGPATLGMHISHTYTVANTYTVMAN